MRCSFCNRKPAASVSKNKRVGCCADCAAVGGDAAEMVMQATEGTDVAKPMFAGSSSKLDKLLATQKGPAALSLTGNLPRRKPAPTPLQATAVRVRGQARSEGREMTRAELSLSLAAVREANSARRSTPGVGGKAGIVEAVRRAGLKA
jgi:hypothetical protein